MTSTNKNNAQRHDIAPAVPFGGVCFIGLILVPFNGDDEPKSLHYANRAHCPKRADGEHPPLGGAMKASACSKLRAKLFQPMFFTIPIYAETPFSPSIIGNARAVPRESRYESGIPIKSHLPK